MIIQTSTISSCSFSLSSFHRDLLLRHADDHHIVATIRGPGLRCRGMVDSLSGSGLSVSVRESRVAGGWTRTRGPSSRLCPPCNPSLAGGRWSVSPVSPGQSQGQVTGHQHQVTSTTHCIALSTPHFSFIFRQQSEDLSEEM